MKRKEKNINNDLGVLPSYDNNKAYEGLFWLIYSSCPPLAYNTIFLLFNVWCTPFSGIITAISSTIGRL